MQCLSRARRGRPNGKRHDLERLGALIEKTDGKAKAKAIVKPKRVNKVSKEWIVVCFSEDSSIRGKECGTLYQG